MREMIWRGSGSAACRSGSRSRPWRKVEKSLVIMTVHNTCSNCSIINRLTEIQIDRQTDRQMDQPQLRLQDTIADDEVQFLQIRSGTLHSDSALHPSLLDLFHHVW